MKVVVQNGSAHGLSRVEIECVLGVVPRRGSDAVRQVVLYQGAGELVEAKFFAKEGVLGLYWPVAGSVKKADAVRELLLALSVIAERGDLPESLSAAKREAHLASSDSQVVEALKCLNERKRPGKARMHGGAELRG